MRAITTTPAKITETSPTNYYSPYGMPTVLACDVAGSDLPVHLGCKDDGQLSPRAGSRRWLPG